MSIFKNWSTAKKAGIGLLFATCVAFAFTPVADRYFEIAKNLEIFASLFKEVNALYVDEVNPNTLIRSGIDEMLASLDPYTNYIPEDEVENYRTENTGQYGGIGVTTTVFGDRMVVTDVMDGHSGQRGGLRIGDELLNVDGIDLKRLTPEQASDLIHGQVGRSVQLTVKRYGEENPITLTLVREHISVENVPNHSMVNSEIGYLHLTQFTQNAGKEVHNAVEALKKAGAKGIILDLRGNGGGLLLESVNVSNVFIDKGQTVVTTRGKMEENNSTYVTLNDPVDVNIPLVVLIDRGSASASEIVAGTIQDYDRGVIIGERSYGKGLVQVSRQLPYHSQFKVTTAKYYTPSGRCIQVLDYSKRRPDGSVASVPDSAKKEFRTKNNRKVYDGGGIEPDIYVNPLSNHSLAEALVEQGVIFDYVTEYTHNKQTLPNPENFTFSDREYEHFVTWANNHGYEYNSALETTLENFKKLTVLEQYNNDLIADIRQIETKIEANRKEELNAVKPLIKKLITNEIIARYNFSEEIEQSRLKHDEVILKALEVFNNPTLYRKTLGM